MLNVYYMCNSTAIETIIYIKKEVNSTTIDPIIFMKKVQDLL